MQHDILRTTSQHSEAPPALVLYDRAGQVRYVEDQSRRSRSSAREETLGSDNFPSLSSTFASSGHARGAMLLPKSTHGRICMPSVVGLTQVQIQTMPKRIFLAWSTGCHDFDVTFESVQVGVNATCMREAAHMMESPACR